MTPDDRNYLFSTEDVVTHTYGYPGQAISTNRNNISKPVIKFTPDFEQDATRTNIVLQPYSDVYVSYDKNGQISAKWKVQLQNYETGESVGEYWYKVPMSSEQNADIPGIQEWTRGSTGNYYAPKDKHGNDRGVPKIGVDPREAGHYESSSISSNKQLGVTKHQLENTSNFAIEGISTTPY